MSKPNQYDETKVDRKKITPPTITISSTAREQLDLILKNDFTLSGKYLRILISGKNCDGFLFSVGFTDLREDDFIIEANSDPEFEVLVDPFTAFYLFNTLVDYQQDFENNREGFIVKDSLSEKFQGKFWRQEQELIPPVN